MTNAKTLLHRSGTTSTMPRRARRGGATPSAKSLKDTILSAAKTADRLLRKTQAISKGAAYIGYGKRKKAPRRRRARTQGGSIFGKVLGPLVSIPGGFIHGATGGVQQAISGLGRRRSNRSRMTGGAVFQTPLGGFSF